MASLRIRARKGRPPTYCVRWRDPDQGGKETSLSWDDEEDAKNFKRILEGNGHRYAPTAAMWKATKSKSPTIAVILDEHIQGLSSVTARGRADYERDAANHITPHLGHHPIDTLTAAHVRGWLRTLADTTASDKTIANLHGLLSSAVATAVQAGHRADNPCRGIKLPRRTEHSAVEMVFLTPGQWAALDTELGNVCGGYYQLLFRTLAGTGARWGEAAALQVSDLSFWSKPPTIRIARALRRDENSRPYIGPTKTPRSRRTISLPEKLAAELAATVKGRPPAERVFNGHTGAPLHHSNIRNRAWLPAVHAAMNTDAHGQHALTVVPRIHDLRHSHASWLFGEGVDILTVQRRLGHESITTTADRYGHLMPGQQIAAATALNGVFS